MKFFGAGCNSLPAVKVREQSLWLSIWCDSKTDSIVWMREEKVVKLILSILCMLILQPEEFRVAFFV